jgi:energy-coupling factor transporter ATP-binding protein EcfA2
VANGGGVLLATHDVHSGSGVVDRTLMLERGVLVEAVDAAGAVPPRSGESG